ncbi:MAG: adenosylcobinamide amidohydrolase [Porticoccaceae bacterium]|nr:adenosylcobinamide amidohydrolase [Pseudomonadales bacterium]MCP5303546.1 adenosylcobinamide amidohydrolase [Pseudomonadales bacterium]
MAFIPLPVNLIRGVEVQHTEQYLRLNFAEPRQVLGNTVLNGGSSQVTGLVNLRVSGAGLSGYQDPAISLTQFCVQQGWSENSVGMMTAASMASARIHCSMVEDEQIAVMVTSGLANARRAGDLAEYRQLDALVTKTGTINTVVLSSAQLSGAVMAEVLMLASEAKAALLQELDIRSPVSNKIATGTGTDAIAVVSGVASRADSGIEKRAIQYAGKHTLLGEVLAKLVMSATAESLQYELDFSGRQQCG